jgi:hypothetical protein
MLTMVAFGCLPLFGQTNATEFQNLTTVNYDNCTGIATIEFPIREDYFACGQANQLRWLDVKAVPPNSPSFYVARIWRIGLAGNPCGPDLISHECQFYNYCELSAANSIVVFDGTGDDEFVRLTIRDLPEEFFGALTKFSFSGIYDLEQFACGNDQFPSGCSDYFIITNFEKDDGQSNTVGGATLTDPIDPVDCQKAYMTWSVVDPPGGCGTVTYDIRRDTQFFAGQDIVPLNFLDAGQTASGPGPGYLSIGLHKYQIRSKWTPMNSSRVDLSSWSGIKNVTIAAPNGKITVNVKTGSNTPISGLTAVATRISVDPTPFCPSLTTLPSMTFGPTDGTGQVEKNNIYYGQRDDLPTVYEISIQDNPQIPTKLVSLDSANNTVTVTLIDTTSYEVTGRLLSDGGCGVAGARITADGHGAGNNALIRADTTDDNGDFLLILPGPDNYGFYSSFITPSNVTVQDSTNMDVPIGMPTGTYVEIQYSKKDTIRGFVGGNCSAIFGPATINVYSDSDPTCQMASTTSDAMGQYQIVLPSHDVILKVEGYQPTMGPLTGQTLSQSQDVALDSTTILNFIFNSAIALKIIGFPEQVCSDISFPILEQFKPYPLVYTVTEANGCLIDTGFIKVIDQISSLEVSPVERRIPISNGIALDTLFPGRPNILGGFSKPITFLAFSGTPTDSIPAPPINMSAIVTGSAPRGTQFTTLSPQLPQIILRAPPGDESYAFFEEGMTFSQVSSFYTQDAKGGSAWFKAKAGVKIFAFEAGIEIGGNFGGEKTKLNSTETLFEFTSGADYQTNTDPNLVGSQGDIYIGAAMNLTYANSDIISFDFAGCKINKRVELVINPDSFSTQFVYSESGILTVIIPGLQQIVDDPTQTFANRHRSREGIKLWRQIINLNAKLKEEAFENGPYQNYSFDGGAGINKKYWTTTTSKKTTLEWSQLITEDITFEAGFEIYGSGASAGFEVNLKQETGGSTTTGITTTTTTGYNLQDDDVNGAGNVPDFFTVDVAIDSVYGTPVFRVPQNAGQTSCPYELGANVFKPYFSIAEPVKYAAPGVNFLEFDFELGNLSELTPQQPGTFKLDMISNPNGASVFVVGPGQSWTFSGLTGSFTQNVRIERFTPSSFYHFEGLRFKFYPECDPFQAVFLEISAFFDSPCSSIGIFNPTASNGFVINEASGNMQSVVIDKYDYTAIGASDVIKLEYAPTGSNSFLPTNIVMSKTDLVNNNPARTTKIWQTDAIADGSYDIRMKLICTDGGNATSVFSERVSGVIDRLPPQIYGIPEPLDDDYAFGDQIAMVFDESIDMTNVTVSLIKQPGNTVVSTIATYVDSIHKLYIMPSYDLSMELGSTFDIMVNGVEDVYGNASELFTWEFTVGEIDSDGNGYSDNYELCIGSALHFVETDYVVVPHNNQLNVVEDGEDFTFEAWVNLSSGDDNNTIVSKGNGGNAQTEYIFQIAAHNSGQPGKIALYLSGQWQYGLTTVPLNKWTHVDVAMEASTQEATFYINGLKDGVKTFTVGSYMSGDVTPMYIGRQGHVCNCNFMNGRLDDVTIWQHRLTQAEIMATMAGALTGTETDLVAHYNFNDAESCKLGTGDTTLTDKSSNNFDGILIGFTLDGCNSNWATERAMDNDRDGIPDGCDEIEPCFDLNDTGDTDGDLLLACADLCPTTKDVAMDFDGIDDLLYHPSSSALNFLQGDFAFEAWINPEGHVSEPIFSGWEPSAATLVSFELRYQKTVLFLKDFTDTIDGGEYLYSVTDIPLNQWSHVAVSFDASTKEATFYLNGEHDGTRQSQLASIEYNPFMRLYIGERRPFDVSEPYAHYNGRMDDLAIWARTLSLYNINQSMAAPLSGSENGLTAFLEMNEGQACVDNSAVPRIIDKSPNGFQFFFINLARTGGCTSNFVMGRNTDSDGDMIGDACDVTAFGCPPNYAGANQLIGDQEYNTFFDTDGAIQSKQRVRADAAVIYNTNTSVELLPNFQVKLGSSLEVTLDGCPD